MRQDLWRERHAGLPHLLTIRRQNETLTRVQPRTVPGILGRNTASNPIAGKNAQT
jgi:hypothetical protein